MSQVYINEPPTHGKVCLETTVGEIEIELFSRECPKTCRNFVQLCMENYYDRTKFHRVVRDFIVQGGDPTGTGQGKKLKVTVKFMYIIIKSAGQLRAAFSLIQVCTNVIILRRLLTYKLASLHKQLYILSSLNQV